MTGSEKSVSQTGGDRFPIVDVDTHTGTFTSAPELQKHLPERWRDWLAEVGFRYPTMSHDRPRQRLLVCRTDAYSPDGGAPGTDPDFVRTQLLDGNDISGAVMNETYGYCAVGGRPMPDALSVALARAYNDLRIEKWMASDDRWYGSVTVSHDTSGEAAAEEIRRCKEDSGEYNDRWVQALLPPDNERPAGHPKYWPMFEVCEHYGIPVGFHVLATRRLTGTGIPNYFLEEHADMAAFNFPLVASLIFEGVFERFPELKIALLELSWSWAVPFSWRLDQAYDLHRSELPHLPRKPSEYFAEHFWFASQPMEEPENLGSFDDVYQLFEDTFGDKLMYSSDYPHWDYDLPETVPQTLPIATRRKILGETASNLYGIPLRAGTGLPVELAAA